MKLLMRDEAKGREHTILVTIFSALMVMLAIVVMLMASATAVSGVTLQLDKNAVDIPTSRWRTVQATFRTSSSRHRN